MMELKDIVKTYQMGKVQVQALRGVSFNIEKGEMVALMGPSGCGKTTLLSIMGCLDAPTSGSYYLDGVEVSNLSDSQLAEIRNRKIGFVFQTFNLLARTSALENVRLPLLYGNGHDSRERALEALKRVGMGHRASHSPAELSGGERQRVAIARALVNNPAIILADEPTGNLDSRSSLDVLDILCELNRVEGITVVVVTHEKEIADRAQRVFVMKDGQIIDEQQVMQTPLPDSTLSQGGRQ
ncbi:MAG: macrolide ABC transporter ATP-binding protein [Chloroflexi bacterium RBG_13_52_14]|nr:MAG: macrolide ABC transporter ATP-binding protein [Chloroflexi bacterium RBG_13_52_14]